MLQPYIESATTLSDSDRIWVKLQKKVILRKKPI